jgi:hypothetical protein
MQIEIVAVRTDILPVQGPTTTLRTGGAAPKAAGCRPQRPVAGTRVGGWGVWGLGLGVEGTDS